MKTTRQKVLDYFYTHPIASAADISQALRMTPSNARHHIQILHSQGLVEKTGYRLPPGKGRPTQLFQLSQQVAGDNLHLLAHAALATLSDQQDEQEYSLSIKKIAHLLASLANQTKNSKSREALQLSGKLVAAIEILNSINYQARWEAHRDGPRIRLGRCPYQKILPQHPELCLMDRFLLEEITTTKAEQIACLAQDASGAVYCLFRLSSLRDSFS